MTKTPPVNLLNPSSRVPRWVRPAVLLLIAAAFGVLYVRYREELSLSALARREAELRLLYEARPFVVLAAAFLAYVVVTGLSLPFAGVMTAAYGWFFRFWPALILVSFASTIGATIAFLLSRFLFREALRQRFGERLAKFNEALQREGAFYLFTLRLIPQVPFFVINVVMGLTPIRTTTFYWVSQLGMLAGTAVFVSAGASVGSLQELADSGLGGILKPQLVLAFLLLGTFPLIVKRLFAAFGRTSNVGDAGMKQR